MPDHNTTLEILELAERDVRLCSICGEPTTLNAHTDGTIWLECSTLAEPKGALGRILTGAVPHFRRQVLAAA